MPNCAGGRDARSYDIERVHTVKNTCADTCRASRCSNDQAKLMDAWFTNNFCLEHQGEEVLRAYFYGDSVLPEPASGAQVVAHQPRARKRRSRQRSKSDPAPIPIPETPDSSEESSDDEVPPATGHRSSTVLPTVGEEGDDSDGPQRATTPKPAEEQRDDTPPATPRRSQKTVHFADSPPRPSSPEKRPAVSADVWAAEPRNQSPPQLRSSRRRRRVDNRHAPPRASSNSVIASSHGREKRYHPSTPKTADVKRSPRTRSNR
ncbi:hypothetical protein CGCSCA4_v007695 [Colletotrichum siamense]|uniref:Uncharacterized protein n=1 Tax=Colletotrichum siamense TaxID=690259 RepID=A0A9P5K3C8_COLSI|nr:hypothetical protein CGCSCA4_v007695 [Colletotrichum siamense]KAF4857730.1 hypothetical protein CGCSCA2_v007934 [Colletotrichum siamense]